MRIKRTTTIFLVFSLLVVILVCLFLYLNNRKVNRGSGLIKAVHYFGNNSWAKNFWNAVEISKIDEDFKEIRSNGFNAVIFVVPWGEFQPSIDPIKYDQTKLNLLSELIDIAEKHDLKVILRVSYYWDLTQTDSQQRFIRLYCDQKVLAAWIDYIKTIYKVVERKHNFYLAFISWEDLWQPFIEYTSLSDADKAKFSHQFQCQIKTPSRYERKFKEVFQYADKLLINRFLIPAQRVFPNLSLEVRVDKDPIYENGNIVEWYYHGDTYNPPNTSTVVVYFNPAIGARNASDEDTADNVLYRLKYLVDDIRNHTDKDILFDQFNFYDNTPSFSYNTRIKESEIIFFLDKSLAFLNNQKISYSLWTYKDYMENYIINPNFKDKLSGWSIFETNSVGSHAEILPNGSLGQKSIAVGNKVCVDGYSQQESELTINGKYKIIISNNPSIHCLTLDEPQDFVSIKNTSKNKLFIDGVSLFSHIQEGKLFGKGGEPTDYLKAIVRNNTL